MTASALVDDFFRHEYGRLVAMLSCRIGVEHIEDIEDAVQSALMAALEHWTISGVPDNPSAWLFRVARNRLIGELRQRTRRRRILDAWATEDTGSEQVPQVHFTDEVQDDLLRMLFLCCDAAIPLQSQLVFALKTLCGFDVREIAIRLFTSEANVYKRLGRARDRLKEGRCQERHPDVDALTHRQLTSRLPAVRQVLYLMFTEGHLSSHTEMAIRRELCDEAMRLAKTLAEHSIGRSPETFALLALMYLHSARMSARHNERGVLLLLEEQDRRLWDKTAIQEGIAWLAKSADGDLFSRYHAEAGIAAEHCLASSFEETRWEKVAECYELLEQTTTSPMHKLNRAVAIAEWKGPIEGLAVLENFEPPTWLAGSYLWAAVLADLHQRCGNHEKAERYQTAALGSAPSPHVTELLKRRLRN